MADSVSWRRPAAPNADVDGDIAQLLDDVCARLPHGYGRRLVRDVARLKLALGFEGEVRDYLNRRSGDYPAVEIVPPEPSSAA